VTGAEGMRRGLLALSGLGVAGTLVELASLRHWQSTLQVVPWLFLVPCGLMVAAVAWWPTPRNVVLARWVGFIVAAAGVVGLIVHIISNMDAAPLDGAVGPTWDTLSIWRQVWMASTGGVGPAPALAAASLAPTGLALALATHRHESIVKAPKLEAATR